MAGHILVVDDDGEALERSASCLRDLELARVSTARSGEEALEITRSTPLDIVVAETTMEPVSGLELLEAVKQVSPSTFVVLTATRADVDSAVAALRGGAFDYLAKPFVASELVSIVRNALERRLMGERRKRTAEELESERGKVQELRRMLRERFSLGHVLGTSPAMIPVYKTIEEVARTDSTVLITGESGTGKGVVAKMIHASSPRGEGPFVEANCVIYSEGVLQSELFGHERGAFTGAARQKRGRFELADGGSILLDEIGEIGPAIQLMLLRFLQEHHFERVGGEETIDVDVRVLAATNRDLERAMASGEFRSDLYYRLNVIPIWLPPLRQRREDIPLLAQKILERHRETLGRPCEGISADAMEAMVEYEWPGNIRELENLIERTLVLSTGETILREDLPPSLLKRNDAPPEGSLQARERQHILDVLRRCGGNKKAAARTLGIHRSSLYSKLRRYEIDPAELN